LPAFDLRRHDAGSETAFTDGTTYPTGGFSGLTNQGTLENLLTSELAYMDDISGSISLFDMRYVDGELLYYLRDEGTMRRRRRTIHFIIDPDDLHFYQYPGSPGQNGILAQALGLHGSIIGWLNRGTLVFLARSGGLQHALPGSRQTLRVLSGFSFIPAASPARVRRYRKSRFQAICSFMEGD